MKKLITIFAVVIMVFVVPVKATVIDPFDINSPLLSVPPFVTNMNIIHHGSINPLIGSANTRELWVHIDSGSGTSTASISTTEPGFAVVSLLSKPGSTVQSTATARLEYFSYGRDPCEIQTMDLTGFTTISMLGSGTLSGAGTFASNMILYLFEIDEDTRVFRVDLTNGLLGNFSFNLQTYTAEYYEGNGVFDLSKIRNICWQFKIEADPSEAAYLNYKVDEINIALCTAPLAMDFNNDCKVDFADFAIFAQSWLVCNLDSAAACAQ
jgi:hypothetical protein